MEFVSALNVFLGGFWWGLIGGAVPELLMWNGIREKLQEVPESTKTRLYWIITVAMAIAGGVLVVIYEKSGITMSPIIAFNIGASAPLALRQISKQTPNVAPGRVD